MSPAAIEADFPRLTREACVPGVAAAIIRGGRVERFRGGGWRGARTPAAVYENTIFDAASLSKPVFARLVSRLIDDPDYSGSTTR